MKRLDLQPTCFRRCYVDEVSEVGSSVASLLEWQVLESWFSTLRFVTVTPGSRLLRPVACVKGSKQEKNIT